VRHKTAELTGPLLRHAVAMALGYRVEKEPHGTALRVWLTDTMAVPIDGSYCWAPDEDGEWGSPIIEREMISTTRNVNDPGGAWSAFFYAPERWHELRQDAEQHRHDGPTALIAAMRAFVASKLGEEVELPD
jgi:hypothetical protein